MKFPLISGLLYLAISATPVQAQEAPAEQDLFLTKKDILQHCLQPKYPPAAMRNRFHGTAHVAMTINEKGEVEAVDFRRSSGWWLLDQATAKALIGCKLLDQPPAKKIIAATRYSWNLEEKLRYDNDPVIRPETCPESDKVRLAGETEGGLGIVVGTLVSREGQVKQASLEWASGDADTDIAAVNFVKACQFNPAMIQEKAYNAPASVRLLEKKAAPAKTQ